MKRFTLSLCIVVASFNAQASSSDPSRTTYAEVKAGLADLAKQYPKTTSVFQLGLNDNGVMIEGVKVGNGPLKNLVVATHHGNEYGSTEVARAFAASVAANPIAGQTVYVIPVLNIPGYDRKSRGETVDGVYHDPNRDYPGPCGTEGPLRLKSTASLAAFVEREGIVTSATLHTFYPAVVYPWGLSSRDLSTEYDDLFKTLVEAATQESHYQTGNSTEVIYAANGTFEDYAFWKHGMWSILFELGNSHNPLREDISEMAKVNVPGLRRLLETAPHERAPKHAFTGKCDGRLARYDRHDE